MRGSQLGFHVGWGCGGENFEGNMVMDSDLVEGVPALAFLGSGFCIFVQRMHIASLVHVLSRDARRATCLVHVMSRRACRDARAVEARRACRVARRLTQVCASSCVRRSFFARRLL